jgi:putative hemolysin
VQRFPRIALIVVASLLLAACVPVPPAPAGGNRAASTATPQTPVNTAAATTGVPPATAAAGSQIANPASVYCVQKGGRLAIVTDAQGEAGICIFSDGSQCDEWAYFRGECAPGQSAATRSRPTGKTPLEATLTPTPAALTTVQAVPAIDSATALQNGQYELPDIGGFQLQDGKYEHKTGTGATEVQQVGLGKTAMVDLNGDGANDAAVELWANTGGSGVFEYVVALLSQGGSLRQAAATLLGDRVKLQSIAVQPDGKIEVTLLAHKDSDPACCPSQLVTRIYELKDGALNLVSEVAATPAP